MIQQGLGSAVAGHDATEEQVGHLHACPRQLLGLGILNYWTETQLKKWADPELDWDEKKLMVLKLLFKLGIVSLAEDTIRWAMAWQLYWLHKTKREWPTYHCIYYDWVLGLKKAYKAMKPESQSFGLLT